VPLKFVVRHYVRMWFTSCMIFCLYLIHLISRVPKVDSV
jgi:hypothetical protein